MFFLRFDVEMIKSNKFVFLFFLKALSLYLIWFFLYEQWLSEIGWVDNVVIDNIVYLTEVILNGVGYDLFVYDHTIGIDGGHGVYIGTPCDAIELMALFSGFVLIIKGSWINRLWFIPVGLIIIHFLNIIRVIALVLIAHYAEGYLEFNHKYTFTLILYVIVFVGWIIWVKYFSKT